MPGARPDLLKPSLTSELAVARPPFTDTAVLLAAFFGGPVGVLGMFSWNIARLGRVRRDAAFVAVAGLAYLFWMLSRHGEAAVTPSSELGRLLGRNAPTLMLTFFALLVFLIAMLRHRREQRSADLFALRRPKPWLPTIGWIVVGTVVDIALRGARA